MMKKTMLLWAAAFLLAACAKTDPADIAPDGLPDTKSAFDPVLRVPDTLFFSAAGTSQSWTIESNVNWTIHPGEHRTDWGIVTVPAADRTGSGDKSVSTSVSPNSGLSRLDSLYVTGTYSDPSTQSSITKKVVVVQMGTDGPFRILWPIYTETDAPVVYSCQGTIDFTISGLSPVVLSGANQNVRLLSSTGMYAAYAVQGKPDVIRIKNHYQIVPIICPIQFERISDGAKTNISYIRMQAYPFEITPLYPENNPRKVAPGDTLLFEITKLDPVISAGSNFNIELVPFSGSDQVTLNRNPNDFGKISLAINNLKQGIHPIQIQRNADWAKTPITYIEIPMLKLTPVSPKTSPAYCPSGGGVVEYTFSDVTHAFNEVEMAFDQSNNFSIHAVAGQPRKLRLQNSYYHGGLLRVQFRRKSDGALSPETWITTQR